MLNKEKQEELIIDEKMTLQIPHRLVHLSNAMSIQ